MADEKQAVGNINDEKNALKNHMDDSEHVANDSTVKFLNGDKTSEVAFVDKDKTSNGEFVGLTKEELMKFANDPFWRRVRIVLMLLFVIVWVVMLAAAIAIIVVAPKCPPEPELDWWKKTVVYHIHPQSFLASNGQDFGDINGKYVSVLIDIWQPEFMAKPTRSWTVCRLVNSWKKCDRELRLDNYSTFYLKIVVLD